MIIVGQLGGVMRGHSGESAKGRSREVRIRGALRASDAAPLRSRGVVAPLVLLLGVAVFCVFAATAGAAEQTVSGYAPAGSDHLGRSVAVSGDTMVVGAPQETVGGVASRGSAIVYARVGGVWTFQQKLTGQDLDDTQSGAADLFGHAVAIDGETIVVGAPLGDGLAGSSGVVYVFVRSGGDWTRQALIDPQAPVGSFVGAAVACDGDMIVVGATQDDPQKAATGPGWAALWTRTAGEWSLQHTLSPGYAAATGDDFGFSVAVDNGTVVVGAPLRDVTPSADAGSVCVYAQAPDWPLQQTLTSTVPITNEHYGYSVAVDGGTLLVGMPGLAAGAVEVDIRMGTWWGVEATLAPAADATGGDRFGASVSLDGELAVVGSPQHSTIKGGQSGAAYVYGGAGAAWTRKQTLVPSSAFMNESAGWAVGVCGTTVIIGSPLHKGLPDLVEAGSVAAFDLDVVGPVVTASVDPAPNAAGWCKSVPSVSLAASDATSGLRSLEYRRSGAAVWSAYATSFTSPDPGERTWDYRATDNEDNVTQGSLVVRLDPVAPTTTAYAVTARAGKKVALPFKVADALPTCGKAGVVLRIYKGTTCKKRVVAGTRMCNARVAQAWKCSLARGVYTVKVYATDIAGNAQSKVGAARLTVR
jgi:hypothetical protein